MAPLLSSCDLEVDVNGEESFILEKKLSRDVFVLDCFWFTFLPVLLSLAGIFLHLPVPVIPLIIICSYMWVNFSKAEADLLCTYSSKLSKLLRRSKSTGSAKNLKVIFNDFPAGARTFELLIRFCYNNGKITLTPSNICLLHSAARYMEMDKSVTGSENLIQEIEKSFMEISFWSWNELVAALKQCQNKLKLQTSSSLLHRCVESLVGRLASASEAISCPSSSSSDSSGVRFSCDTKSTESLRNSTFRVTCWFEELIFLNAELIPIVVKSMMSQKVDHLIISKFLCFYHRSKFTAATADEKSKISMAVIDMLYLLDWSLVSFKSLLGLLRVTLSLHLDKLYRTKLEAMIGSQLDQATLDNLLIPSPNGSNYLYDVNLVLRLVKAFVRVGCAHMSPVRLRNVASLMDSYISEVVPDPSLKPYKLLALATAVPDVGRESCDGIYHAIDMYLQVHTGLSKEDKSKICSVLNYDKLSLEACIRLAQNIKFPSKPAVQALKCQQYKLKSVQRNVNPRDDLQISASDGAKSHSDEPRIKVVSHDEKDVVALDNQNLKEHIHGMQWRLSELEKLCKKMQSQMTKILKPRPVKHTGMRSLPKLCS